MSIEYTHQPVPDQNMEPDDDETEEEDEGLDADELADRAWDDARDEPEPYEDYGDGY